MEQKRGATSVIGILTMTEVRRRIPAVTAALPSIGGDKPASHTPTGVSCLVLHLRICRFEEYELINFL